MICKKINEYLEDPYRTSSETLFMVSFGLFWIHMMICLLLSGMDVNEYVPIYLKGLFIFILKVVLGVLIIDGVFYMFKALVKWLRKNQKWFEDTEGKLKELERRVDNQRDYLYALERGSTSLKENLFKFETEQGKIKKFIDFVNEEKIEKAAAQVEKSIGVDEF